MLLFEMLFYCLMLTAKLGWLASKLRAYLSLSSQSWVCRLMTPCLEVSVCVFCFGFSYRFWG